jgi:hypothetical protein
MKSLTFVVVAFLLNACGPAQMREELTDVEMDSVTASGDLCSSLGVDSPCIASFIDVISQPADFDETGDCSTGGPCEISVVRLSSDGGVSTICPPQCLFQVESLSQYNQVSLSQDFGSNGTSISQTNTSIPLPPGTTLQQFLVLPGPTPMHPPQIIRTR